MQAAKRVFRPLLAVELCLLIGALVLTGCASAAHSGGGGDPAALAIVTASLPNGQVGTAYNGTLLASGGTTPYTWSLLSGTLPAGLRLDAGMGAIVGTPTATVTNAALTFKVQDAGMPAQTKTVSLTLTVLPTPPTVTTNSLPNGQVGVAYNTTLAATGGTPGYTWTITSGTLPNGMQLNAATGAITGTPTAPVTNLALTFKVTDSGTPAQSGTANLTLTIAPATLAITTSSLPNGQVGVPYNATLAATGGTAPFTWSITSGALPNGMQLNASTGAITGTPTVAVTNSPLTFQVQDAGTPQQTKTVSLTLTIAPATLAITTSSLPNGQVGVAYNATVAATGGTTPYSWTITNGTLPNGLQLNAATGAITGTPTATVTNLPLTFQVQDSGAPQQTKTMVLHLTILPAPPTITTTSLPNGQVGVAYSTTLAATGGTPGYTWTITSGTLPNGMQLNAATGAITGTPTAPVTNLALTFKVTDSGTPAQSGTANLTLTIAPATLVITTTSLANGQVGVAYNATLAATGGTTPFTWSITSGALPNGLQINAATGAITGTPTVAVTNSPLTFQVQDAGTPKQTKTVNLTLTIAPATLVITTSSLPNGQVGVAYNATVAATGGTTPYSWTITNGTLPNGLQLNAATGAITGTPTATVTNLPLTFQVQDSGAPQQVKTVTLNLTVLPTPPTITTASLPDGQVGVAYSTTLAATGGTPGYTWTITSGTLPNGMQLNASTGAITGTPTVPVTNLALTFKVTDSGTPAQSGTANLTLTIAPATLVITTTSLANGQVGVAYNATLASTGGTSPFTWTITSGALPNGMQLNAGTGAITGTPTVPVTNSPLTFQVQDAGTPKQTKTVNLTLTIAPATLVITTTSLPGGLINTPYSTTLAATGGTTPYSWTQTGGTLPNGLLLNGATGVISGTPTVSVTNAPLTFQVQDAGTPQQSKSVNLTLTIAAVSNISVAISPRRGGITLNQALGLTATVTNDIGAAGVSWSVSAGGTLGSQTLTTASFSAGTAGVYTITATSNADNSKSASVTIGVTDLAAVATYHNNASRDGTNTQEYALTTANVTTATFGKLFSCAVDGAVYAQPLWVANLSIGGGTHNVVFVATTHDTVYAFDADAGSCVTYWQKSLLGTGETFVDWNDVGTGDIQPDIGIIGTPVIDLSSNTIYVVAKSKKSGTNGTPAANCHQRLHGLSLIDGTEKFGGPATIDATITYPGNGDDSTGGVIPFNTLRESQRPGLALVNGKIYVTWASHGDNDPYHGWVMGFTANNLGTAPAAVWNSTPNLVSGFSNSRGGIWMSGGAPASDSSNNIYFLTGNGSFDAGSGGSNYGDSTVKLSTSSGLSVAGFFTPDNQQNLDSVDKDHGSGGAAILIDQPSGAHPHLLIGGGKDAVLYLVDRDSLGGYSTSANNVVQPLNFGNGIFATSAFWNNNLYLAGVGGALKQFAFNTGTGLFGVSASHTSPTTFGFPGFTPSVSSTGSATNGIVWGLDTHHYCTEQSVACGPAILHAYDATNVNTELWNSSQAAGNRDAAGNAVKFTVPTIANGKVYVGTRGNNAGGASGTTSTPGELDVYGLLP